MGQILVHCRTTKEAFVVLTHYGFNKKFLSLDENNKIKDLNLLKSFNVFVAIDNKAVVSETPKKSKLKCFPNGIHKAYQYQDWLKENPQRTTQKPVLKREEIVTKPGVKSDWKSVLDKF